MDLDRGLSHWKKEITEGYKLKRVRGALFLELRPVVPFEPVSTDAMPFGNQWVAQIKRDGVRVLTYFDGKEVRLINRKLNDRTLQYPEISNIRSYSSANSVILDGEVISLKDGKPSFHEIMRRDS